MAKKLINKKGNYTTIQNELINDKSISLKAKGILLYMLSKPYDWKYNPKEIAANSKDGLDSVYSGLKELIEAGYVSRKRYADGRVDYYVFEDKSENDIEDFSLKEENPNRENPNRENPNRDFPDVYKRKNTTKERNILNTEYNKKENKKERNEIDDYINAAQKSEEYKNLLLEFVKYRKKIKLTLRTPGPIKTLINFFPTEELLKEALEYMDMYNWRTAEPQWIENKKQGGNNNGGKHAGYSKTNGKHSEKPDYSTGFEDWN